MEDLSPADIIRLLIDVLPGSGTRDHPCWEWCWNELNDEAQAKIESTRKLAEAWLEQHKRGQ